MMICVPSSGSELGVVSLLFFADSLKPRESKKSAS